MGNLLRRTGRHSGAGTAGAGRGGWDGSVPRGARALSHAHAARLGPRTHRHHRITVNGCRLLRTSPSSAAASPAPRSPTSWRRPGRWCCWRPRPPLGTHSTARSAATWIPGHGVAAVRALITASGPRFAVPRRRTRCAAAALAPAGPVDGDRRRGRGRARRTARRACRGAGRARPRRPRRGPPALPRAARRPRRRAHRGGRRRRRRRPARRLRARAATPRRHACARRPGSPPWTATAPAGGSGSPTATRCSSGRSSTRQGRGRTPWPPSPGCRRSGSPRCGGRSRWPGCPIPRDCSRPTAARCRWSARPRTAGTSRPTGPICWSHPPTRPRRSPGTPVRTSWTWRSPWSGSRRSRAWGCARS